jgi:hypothetical protein
MASGGARRAPCLVNERIAWPGVIFHDPSACFTNRSRWNTWATKRPCRFSFSVASKRSSTQVTINDRRSWRLGERGGATMASLEVDGRAVDELRLIAARHEGHCLSLKAGGEASERNTMASVSWRSLSPSRPCRSARHHRPTERSGNAELRAAPWDSMTCRLLSRRLKSARDHGHDNLPICIMTRHSRLAPRTWMRLAAFVSVRKSGSTG